MKITAIVKKSPMTWHNQILNNLVAATQSEEGLGVFTSSFPQNLLGSPADGNLLSSETLRMQT
jgi:hypothetical protein